MTASSATVAALLALVARAQQQEPYVPRIAAASDEAQQAIAKFAPAAGIHVELFAAEPMLANPVSFDVADDGTVYVAETFRHHQGVTDIRDHMTWLDDDLASRTVDDRRAMLKKHEGANYDAGYGRAFEQVRRIVDRDADGKADEATVFATKFDDHAAGIGAGVLAYEDSVYYTCIPDLWLLRDGNGDGVADTRRALSSGYGVHVALLGHDLHGLTVGPDRRLYFSCGDRGFHVETPDGVIAHPQCGAVLRCELDGSHLEVWHTGLRNPQELAFDDFGNLWTGDNNSDGGDRARWVNVVEGGDSGWRYPYQWITEPVARGPWNDEKLWHPHHAGQAAYIVPPVANLADGPAGLACYPGTGLAPEYAGHFFLCDFRGDASASGIHTFTVEPRGASFALGPVTHFLWGSLVTDCDFGPDGALWFSDWVYGWEQTGKGRLYRCVDEQAQSSALVAETASLLARGMVDRPEEELVELLGHPDRRVRQEAHFELAERGLTGRLTAIAIDGSQELRKRLHAIWALGIALRTRGDAPGGLLAACEVNDTTVRDSPPPSNDSAEVRAQAIRVLGDARCSAAGDTAVRMLDDPSPRVRFFAALAAGRLRVPAAVEPLARVLRDAGENDTNLRHAAVMGLLGCAAYTQLCELAKDPSPDVRMGALLVFRRLDDRTIARFLDDEDPRLVLEAARAIHDVPVEGALSALADAELAPGVRRERPFARRALNASYRLGRAQRLADHAENTELALELRVEALDMLAHWSEPSARDRVTNEWRPIAPRAASELPAIAARLARGAVIAGPDALVEAYVGLVRSSGARELAPVLANLVGDVKRGSGVKIAALETLEALEAENLVPTVRAALGDRDGRVRAAALERLDRFAPGEVLASLSGIVESGEIAERRASYRILARHAEPESVEKLASELDRLLVGLLPAELALDLVEACEQRADPALAERLARLRAARPDNSQLAPYLDGLFGGDAAAGDRVFQRVELSCTRCHAWWRDADQRVGPNLFGVGERLTRLQILEAIALPNRRITPGYGAEAFFLDSGKVVAGRVVEESDSLVRLFNAQNEPVAIDRAEIVERRADLSAMPEDLTRSIAPRDMRDLLEYLGQL